MPKPRKNTKKAGRRKQTVKKTSKGLTNVQRQQVKKIAIANTETKWCNPYGYDFYPEYDAPRINAPLSQPVPIPGCNLPGQSAYFIGLETGVTTSTQGSNLNTASPPQAPNTQLCINQIGMYNFGTSSDAVASALDPGLRREGEYMMAQSQAVKIEIDMRKLEKNTEIADAFTPYEFRLIAVKRRPRRVVATGAGPDFRTEMFRNYANAEVGFSNKLSVKEFFDYPINKEAFTVLKDIKFKLSPQVDPLAYNPVGPDVGAFPNIGNNYNSFPNRKELTMYLPKPKNKIKWNENAISDPDDSFNYKVNIFVMASQTGSESAQNQADRWIMKVHTCSKFKDV